MSESAERREPEPELAFLDEVREEPPALDEGTLDELFESVQREVRKSGSRPLARLSEQPTGRRRLFGLLCFGLILLGLGAVPTGGSPLALAIVLGAFGVLLVAAVLVAFRPIHVPALSPVWKVGLCGAAIAAAFTVALVPQLHPHATDALPADAFLGHALPCLSFGLLAGLPGYVLLRLLDRGAPFGRVLAGTAAGLTANMVLELRCAIGSTEHLVLGHAVIVVLFVGGVVFLERVLVRSLAAKPRS